MKQEQQQAAAEQQPPATNDDNALDAVRASVTAMVKCLGMDPIMAAQLAAQGALDAGPTKRPGDPVLAVIDGMLREHHRCECLIGLGDADIALLESMHELIGNVLADELGTTPPGTKKAKILELLNE